VGCDFICVLSGETTREQIDELSEDEFPSLIVKDLGDLLTWAAGQANPLPPTEGSVRERRVKTSRFALSQ
jgi:hypothetical protein